MYLETQQGRVASSKPPGTRLNSRLRSDVFRWRVNRPKGEMNIEAVGKEGVKESEKKEGEVG